MSDLNMQMVREFFELRSFHVLTHWQHEGLLPKSADPCSLLFVENAQAQPRPGTGFVLSPDETAGIHRAVVEVRAWHADRFYASVIENSAALSHVGDSETRQLGRTVFGSDDFVSILVLSRLPASAEPRARSLALLRERGVDHVFEFPTLLQDMLERISAHGNYAPSQTLQTMRILKRYNLVRRQQLEFAFSTEAPATGAAPEVDAEALPLAEDDDED